MKLLTSHIIKISVFFLIFIYSASAQQESVNNIPSPEQDTAFVMQKSPWTAVLFSAVIPGAGQIYNESYIKAPIIWGVLGALTYGWIQYNKDYKFYKDRYIESGVETYKTNREFYRDQRDLLAIYIGLTYLLNLVDAYVDAQLFDFTVDENFHTGQRMIGLKINF